MALRQRRRGGLVSALRRQDWNWLELGSDPDSEGDASATRR